MVLSEKKLHQIIKQVIKENLENEVRTDIDNLGRGTITEVDNFQEIQQLLNFSSPDDVYFVKLVKRRKDNPQANLKGDEYPKYYLIHSIQELMSYEREIKALCIRHNLRAYITCNKRSLKDGMEWVTKYKADPRKYRHMQGHEVESAFGRSFADILNRDVVMIDIDTDDKSVHQKVHDILNKYNVKIIMEYPSLNNGLHIFTKSQEEIIDAFLCKEFMQFDGGQDLGRLATVGIDFDKNALLYCCLQGKGYRGATNYSQATQASAQADAVKYRQELDNRYTKLTGKKHQ